MPSMFLCTIFLVVAVGRGCCFGAPLENPFPLGTIGKFFYASHPLSIHFLHESSFNFSSCSIY